MTATSTDLFTPAPSPAASAPSTDTLAPSRRLLLWTLRFVMPVFVLFTLWDLQNISLTDRLALAIAPLTWLLLERAVRGETLGRARRGAGD